MARFAAGFATASVLWGAVIGLYLAGIISLPIEGDGGLVEPDASPVDAAVEEQKTKAKRAKRRRGRRRRKGRAKGGRPRGDDRIAQTGDDLGEDEPRHLDLTSGGGQGSEGRLSPGQIDAGFDQAMGRIRRCMLLLPDDVQARGRITFGLRIRGSGQVTRVSLRGPASLTSGQTGGCLRQAARAIDFPSFDGPEMVAHYPITFE